MKKITHLLRIGSFICLLLCTAMWVSCEDDSDENTGGGGGNSVYGTWVRVLGASGDRTDLAIGDIDGEPENRVYMCEKRGSTAAGFYKGYIDGHYITWDSQYGLPDTFVEVVNGTLEFSYPDCDVCLVTDYVRGSWDGECGDLNGGGGGGNGDGSLMFWVQNDLGCGYINVSVGGYSGNISGYYNTSPSCGASSAANFTLPAGNYNFSASCDGMTWSGTVTVTSGGCFKMQLTP